MNETQTRSGRRWYGNPDYWLAIVILLNLILGGLIAKDFGESWDEHKLYQYADNSLLAYANIWGDEEVRLGPDNLRFYGPAYVMFGSLASRLLNLFPAEWQAIDGWHYLHFITFQLGVLCLYIISKRMMTSWAAFGTTLLFSSQPLLFGHAFINPKDIPFMSLFLASIATGWAMGDKVIAKVSREENSLDGQSSWNAKVQGLFRSDWAKIAPRGRRIFLGSMTLVIIAILLFGNGIIGAIIDQGIRFGYSADPASLTGQLFSRLAINAPEIPVEVYVNKGLLFFGRARFLLAGTILVALSFIALRLLPHTRDLIWNQIVSQGWKQYWRSLRDRYVLLPGIVLGLCTSLRVLGPAAGILVALYMLMKSRGKTLPAIFAYFSTSAIVTYITWPYLWPAPVRNFLQSIRLMIEFPWQGKVLFNGIEYASNELPSSYLPTLLSMQLTEPMIPLFAIGMVAASVYFLRRRTDRAKLALTALWLYLPFGYVVLLRPTMYDNFRQYLFIIPPIFIFAGLGLEAIFKRIRSPWISVSILILLTVPGLYGNYALHPYEYVYYNSLAGGVGGVFRRFELDYWATSLREATEFVNQSAKEEAKVVVWGPTQIVETYAREDLEIEVARNNLSAFDYAIVITKRSRDLSYAEGFKDAYEVSRQGAIFAVVKQPIP